MDTHNLINHPVVTGGLFSENFSDNLESSISIKNTEKSSIVNVDNNNNNSNLIQTQFQIQILIVQLST